MRPAPLRPALLAWLLILALAVANGALREALLIPALGRFWGLVLSGGLLALFILLVARSLVRHLRGIGVVPGLRIGLRIGLLWLLLTLAFEFGFGRYVQHKPWPELLAAYTFEDGNLWPLLLLVTLLAPALAGGLDARAQRRGPGA